MIDIDCPSCHARYRLKDEMRGKKARCKQCNSVIVIPTFDIPDVVVETAPQPQRNLWQRYKAWKVAHPNLAALRWIPIILFITPAAILLCVGIAQLASSFRQADRDAERVAEQVATQERKETAERNKLIDALRRRFPAGKYSRGTPLPVDLGFDWNDTKADIFRKLGVPRDGSTNNVVNFCATGFKARIWAYRDKVDLDNAMDEFAHGKDAITGIATSDIRGIMSVVLIVIELDDAFFGDDHTIEIRFDRLDTEAEWENGALSVEIRE